jgi:hypothetical protein
MEVKRVEVGRTLVKMKGLRPRWIIMKDSMQTTLELRGFIKRYKEARGQAWECQRIPSCSPRSMASCPVITAAIW